MELFVFLSCVASIAAWLSARSTRTMAQERLAAADRRMEAMQRTLNALAKAEAERVAAASLPLVKSAETTPPSSTAVPLAPVPIAELLPVAESATAAAPVPIAELVSASLPNATTLAAAPGAVESSAPRAAGGHSLEEKVALVWFTRIGAAALLIGVAFFFKYAVDNDWIGPLGRVALGALTGAGLLAAAEITRTRTKAIFLQVLLGVGLSFLYLSVYASHAFYGIVPTTPAFAALVVVSLLGGALAVRHRGEPILILSLLAALLAPVLISTHQNRPLALFSYTLLITGLSFLTSVRMGFRYANWLGIGGASVLFAGWYGTFFHARMPEAQELFADGNAFDAALYIFRTLRPRIVPLGAVAAFLAEWIAVARFARTREPGLQERLQPVPFLVAALLLAHAGFAVLLFDAPPFLGLMLACLGLLSSYLLGLENRRDLLGLPLVTTFCVLLFTVHREQTDPTGMLAVLGLVGVIYGAGLLHGQFGAAKKPDPLLVMLLCAVGVALALCSAVLLFELHPATFSFVLAALSLSFAALSLLLGVPVVAAGAAALSVCGLLATSTQHSEISTPLLIAAALNAAIYFASGAYELLVRKLEATQPRLFTVSAAGLGFALLVETSAPQSQWLLRSTAPALVGVLDLLLGVALLRRSARKPATVLLGQALALFAAAAAMLFSGATVTVIWAALAAVVAVLAAADEDPRWLAGASLLFVATVLRALFVDFEIPEQEQQKFFATLGEEGRLRAHLIFNPRAGAFAATALALFVAARSTARRTADWFRQSSLAFALSAHALLVLLAILEAHNLALTTPLPDAIPFAEDSGFISAFNAAVYAQAEALSVVTTVVMALYASMLVSIGFGARSRNSRLLGLSLFALTLGKLARWDIWHLARIYQMVVLVALGALMLASSYLYARFGKRLVTLLRDGELPSAGGAGTGAMLIFIALSLASGTARAADAQKFARFEQQRAIEHVSDENFYRVEIDPPLYRATRAQFDDVRIESVKGDEAPFLVRDIPADVAIVRHEATVVDALVLPDGSSRAVLDLGRMGLKHSEVALEIEGSDFLRHTRIEISNDEQKFDRLTEGQLVYRVVSGEQSGSSTTLTYPVSDARYLRVTLLPGADKERLRITAAHLALTSESSRLLQRSLAAVVSSLPRKSDARQSAWLLDLGAPGVPIESLLIDVQTTLFERRVSLSASDDQRSWSSLGGGLLYRAANAEGLTLSFSSTRARFLRLAIDDGDDPPLLVRAATASYRAQELVFRAAAGGVDGQLAPRLLVGRADAAHPLYDLASVIARYGDALRPAQAAFGPLEPNPDFRAPVPKAAPLPPASERHKGAIVAALSLLLLVLALWTIRLLKSSNDNESASNTTPRAGEK